VSGNPGPPRDEVSGVSSIGHRPGKGGLMRKKRIIAKVKRFELSRETLRNLQEGDYKGVAAGAISASCTTTCHPPCPRCDQ
jgi:hypothetical protein